MKINKTKVLFKNITSYNNKNYAQFLKFHNDKYECSYNSYTIIMSILLIYCVIINIKNKNILTTLLFILLLISFVLLRFYLPLRRLKKTKENIRKSSTSIHTFFFYYYYYRQHTN